MAQTRLVGLEDFRRDLRRIDKRLSKQIAVANKAVSVHVTNKATDRARLRWGSHVSQAKGIRPSGTQKRAQIRLNSGRTKRIFAAEFGTKTHKVPRGRPDQNVTGPRMKPVLARTMRRRVFPPWTGNQWNPGEGPGRQVGTAVNPTIREEVDSGRVPEMFLDALDWAFAEAFPEVGF